MTASIGVVLNTYNRSRLATNAVKSVLGQSYPNFRLAIVDDGSTDDTQAVLSHLAEPRISITYQENMGLCAARNVGASLLDTEWLVFLDDDDQLLPDALAVFASHFGPEVGLVVGGVVRVLDNGQAVKTTPPAPLYDFFDGSEVNVLAGSFCLRRDVFGRAGEYLSDLPYGHQTEMLLRYWRQMSNEQLRVSVDQQAVLRYTVRDAADRPMQDPCLTAIGAARILSHQPWIAAQSPHGYDSIARVGAVGALRAGELRLAHALFRLGRSAVRVSPRSITREAISLVPIVRSRVWPDFRTGTSTGTPCAVRRSHDRFLPCGYISQEEVSQDRPGRPYWNPSAPSDPLNQWPVYRLARRLARRGDARVLIDIGCGTGEKLARIATGVSAQVFGVDQASAIRTANAHRAPVEWLTRDLDDSATWRELSTLQPDVVLCVDVIEHLEDPYRFLDGLRSICSERTAVVISTPDRTILEGTRELGPPTNARHVQEWAPVEFELLLRSAGFSIDAVHHRLPRGYRPTAKTAKRMIWRALHGKPLPDRRSSMIFRIRITP